MKCAVYTHRQNSLITIWHGFKLAMKLVFAVGMLWAYAVVGFSL